MELDSVIRKWVRNESREADILIVETSSPEGENGNINVDIPGVDTEKGLTHYGNDMDIYLSLLRSYVSNTPGVLNKLKTVSKETLPDYVITAHGLKGTSAGIGVETIRRAALDLETEARAGNLDTILDRKDKLIAEAEIVIANIRSWLKQYDSNNAKPLLTAPDPEVLARLRQSCENYDMSGIDRAMADLESYDYEEESGLVAWIKGKIAVSEMAEVAERLANYEKGLVK